jgi:hypothetical protein
MPGIRNISQTVQEREIVKTAPDIVVYLDGLPYLLNYFIDDPNTMAHYSIVNFNDFVTAFNCLCDTDIMVPSASIGLQVPNYLKHLFMMPGGNNLIRTMMEIQVFAKGYYLANHGETVYRRVFKGVVGHIGYNDNGKTLEISVQCHGTMHFLELMQVNLNPSIQSAVDNNVAIQYQDTKYADNNPYEIIAAMLTDALDTSIFTQDAIGQSTPGLESDPFHGAVAGGFIVKWNAVLNNLAKDIHIYGTSYKDRVTEGLKTKPSEVQGDGGKDLQPAANAAMPTQNTAQKLDDLYYLKIRDFAPESKITGPSLLNNRIVTRLEHLRKLVQIISFEAYQDIDGKIIIKPPLYNLDVTDLGPRNVSTSPDKAGSGDPYSSASNPLTEINENTNPFVVHLSEILTENETEDEAAVRKTRCAVQGSLMPSLQMGLGKTWLGTADWIDIPKLQQFGLREEPTLQIPWIQDQDKVTLFSHAVCETVRANRGYRTYTVTIPMRPELKIGFPMYFPHKDMYGYIKSVNTAYQVGGTAVMTVVCDSIRKRVLVPQSAKSTDGVPYTRYTSSQNLVYQFTKSNFTAKTGPDPNQSSGNNLARFQSLFSVPPNPANPVGQAATLTTPPGYSPSTHDNILQTQRSQRLASSWNMQPDTPTSSYVVVPDGSSQHGTAKNSGAAPVYGSLGLPVSSPRAGSGYWDHPRRVDNSYFVDLQRGTIPFTDKNGYEVLAPFPWGRWRNLRETIKEFTEDGYIAPRTDVNGNPTTNQQDISVLNATESFLFAGLGTPTATDSPSNALIAALAQLQNQAETDTVIVLDYSQPQSGGDKQLLNAAQPDIQNRAAALQLANTVPTEQQLITVLVSGQVSPKVGARQAQQQLSATPDVNATPTSVQWAAQKLKSIVNNG